MTRPFLPCPAQPLFKWFTLPVMAVFTFLITGAENVGKRRVQPGPFTAFRPPSPTPATTLRGRGKLVGASSWEIV